MLEVWESGSTRDNPKAAVATPTTIAVSIKTCGSGFEYIASTFIKIGAVPSMIFARETKNKNTEVWNISRPTIYLIKYVLVIMINKPPTNRKIQAKDIHKNIK
mgnify:CR=1 FL=1